MRKKANEGATQSVEETKKGSFLKFFSPREERILKEKRSRGNLLLLFVLLFALKKSCTRNAIIKVALVL